MQRGLPIRGDTAIRLRFRFPKNYQGTAKNLITTHCHSRYSTEGNINRFQLLANLDLNFNQLLELRFQDHPNPEDDIHMYSATSLSPDTFYDAEMRFDSGKIAVQVLINGQVVLFDKSKKTDRTPIIEWVPVPVSEKYFQITDVHGGCYGLDIIFGSNKPPEEYYYIDNGPIQILKLLA